MRSFRKKARIAALLFVAALILAQAVQVERSNPPVQSDIAGEPAVMSLLHRACYNCHSNKTVWPWYAHVAPASWLLASDVNEGRRRLNFSEWGTYTDAVRSHKLLAIADEIRDSVMPPWYYSIMHRDSRLTAAERGQIQAWTDLASEAATK
jgi:hypothetical protein